MSQSIPQILSIKPTVPTPILPSINRTIPIPMVSSVKTPSIIPTPMVSSVKPTNNVPTNNSIANVPTPMVSSIRPTNNVPPVNSIANVPTPIISSIIPTNNVPTVNSIANVPTPMVSSINQGFTSNIPLVINPTPPIVNTSLKINVIPQPINKNIQHPLTLEEKHQRRLQQKREGQSRYREKSKAYTKLHGFKNDQGKIIALLRILYPHLEDIPDYILEPEVLQFISSINRPR